MKTEPNTPARVPIPVVVPRGGRFEGLIAFRDHARIEGDVIGQIAGTGRLEIGDSASISGPIQVDEVVSAGRISGDVETRQRVELTEGATLSGTLRTPLLAVADGAVVRGHCSVGDSPKQRA